MARKADGKRNEILSKVGEWDFMSEGVDGATLEGRIYNDLKGCFVDVKYRISKIMDVFAGKKIDRYNDTGCFEVKTANVKIHEIKA